MRGNPASSTDSISLTAVDAATAGNKVIVGSDGEGLPNDEVDEHEQDHWDAQDKPMSKFPIKQKGEE